MLVKHNRHRRRVGCAPKALQNRVYNAVVAVIEMHEHKGEFKEPWAAAVALRGQIAGLEPVPPTR
jgi:hypothetical protein